MLHVILVEPEIPPNTGNMTASASRPGRDCTSSSRWGSRLTTVRCAEMDYWHEVDLRLWPDFASLQAGVEHEARFFFFTTKDPPPLLECRLPGRPGVQDKTFKEMALRFPILEHLRQARKAAQRLSNFTLPVGKDGRNRKLLSPFHRRLDDPNRAAISCF